MAAPFGVSANGVPLTPLDVAFVLHEEDSLVGEFMAMLTLAPLAVGIALGTMLLARRELATAYWLVGHLVGSATCVVLKAAIAQPRPPIGGKSGFGMPSNHAWFMTFLSTYLSLLLVHGRLDTALPAAASKSESRARRHLRALPTHLLAWLGCAAVIYSRVYLGVHTPSQVGVGAVLGAVQGYVWHAGYPWVTRVVFPAVEEWRLARSLLVKDSSGVDSVLQREYEDSRRYRKLQ